MGISIINRRASIERNGAKDSHAIHQGSATMARGVHALVWVG